MSVATTQYGKMKTIKRLSIVSALCALSLLTACQRELKPASIVGSWNQIALTSQIGDNEPDVITEPSTWVFASDSTYTIVAGDETENGSWSFASDSTLMLTSEGDTSSYKVIKCSDDSLIQQVIIDTDFGVITETTILVKNDL